MVHEYVIPDKLEFSNYIATLYNISNHTTISPLKLQKTMYFLYAYWIKIVGAREVQNSEIEDDNYSDRLFYANFRAWKYGPVDLDIYYHFKGNSGNIHFDDKDKLTDFESAVDTITLDFIQNLVEDLFATNDFILVDISHEDSCWKNSYDSNNINNNEIITHEAIVVDYVN